MNHEKIAESVSKVLDDLSDDILYWRELFDQSENSMRAKGYVAKLYVVVFKFLATIMTKWSSRSSVTRLLRSFDSDFFQEEIGKKKTEIEALERRFKDHSNLKSQQALTREIEKISQSQADAQARFDTQLTIISKQLELQIGLQAQKMLEDQLHHHGEGGPQKYLDMQRSLAGVRSTNLLAMASGTGEAAARISALQLKLLSSKQLRKYEARQDIDHMLIRSRHLCINSEILSRIKLWNASTESHLLWICGPFMAPQPSKYSLLSACMIQTAQRADVPVIYYFCDFKTGLVDLVYSLMAQLLQIIPDIVESDRDFSYGRFETLDEKNESIDSAINLLGDLLSVGPEALFVVVDGVQWLTKPSFLRPAQRFFDLLRASGEEEGSRRSRLIKTFSTTDGASESLSSLQGVGGMSIFDVSGESSVGPEADEMEVSFL